MAILSSLGKMHRVYDDFGEDEINVKQLTDFESRGSFLLILSPSLLSFFAHFLHFLVFHLSVHRFWSLTPFLNSSSLLVPGMVMSMWTRMDQSEISPGQADGHRREPSLTALPWLCRGYVTAASVCFLPGAGPSSGGAWELGSTAERELAGRRESRRSCIPGSLHAFHRLCKLSGSFPLQS